MANVNDSAAVILAHAAARSDLRVLPLPKGLSVKGAAATNLLNSLVRTGLLASVDALPDDVAWAHDEAGGRRTLVATHEGLRSIGIEDEGKSPNGTTNRRRTAKAATKAATARNTRPTSATSGKGEPDRAKKASAARGAAQATSKQDIVVGMLRRPTGASIAELADATGWQPHSVRGVLTATIKGRLGLSLSSEKGDDGVRRYFVPAIRDGKPS